MPDAPSPKDTLPEALAARFESAWKLGQQPDLASFAANVPPAYRQVVLIELINLDLEYRRRNGQSVALEDYLHRFPELRDAHGALSAAPGRLQAAPSLQTITDPERTVSAPGIGPSVRYQLLGEVGRGGFAVVYKAIDTRLNRMVAIKRLLPEKMTGTALERFIRESRAIAALSHRNIVQVYDSDQDAEGYHIIMEYVDGGSLRDYLKSRGRVAVAEALTLVGAVAQGLAFAHRRNLVHRDIKPANILLSREGDLLVPRIADFGLAQLGRDSSLSDSGCGMGTPLYMPPEQRQDAKNVNQTADIFALGKVLYELVTGETPDVVHPKHVPPPARLAAVILKCVEPRPEDRFFSAEDFIRALGEVETNVAPSALPPAQPTSINACPACGTDNDRGARFCIGCGISLRRNCPECARETGIRIVYCPDCGTAIETFSRLQQALAQMERSRDEHAPDRVLEEAQRCGEQMFEPRGKNGRVLLAKIEVLRARATEAKAVQDLAAAQRQREERELRAAMADARGRRAWPEAIVAANALLKLEPPDTAQLHQEIRGFEAAAADEVRRRQVEHLLDHLAAAEDAGEWQEAAAVAQSLLKAGAGEHAKAKERRDRAVRAHQGFGKSISLLRAGRFADCQAACERLAIEFGADLPVRTAEYEGSCSRLAALARVRIERQVRCDELRRQLDEAKQARAWRRGRCLAEELLRLEPTNAAATALIAASRLRRRVAAEIGLGLAILLLCLLGHSFYWQRQIGAFDAALAAKKEAEAERIARTLDGRHPAAAEWLEVMTTRKGRERLTWKATWRARWEKTLPEHHDALAQWAPSSFPHAKATAMAAIKAESASVVQAASLWRQACQHLRSAIEEALRAEAGHLVLTCFADDSERSSIHEQLEGVVSRMRVWLPGDPDTLEYAQAAQQLSQLLKWQDEYEAAQHKQSALLQRHPTERWEQARSLAAVARAAAAERRWEASATAWGEASKALDVAVDDARARCVDEASKACDAADETGDWAAAQRHIDDALKVLPDSVELKSLSLRARVMPGIVEARGQFTQGEKVMAGLFEKVWREYKARQGSADARDDDPDRLLDGFTSHREAAQKAERNQQWESAAKAWRDAGNAIGEAIKAGERLKDHWITDLLKSVERDKTSWEHKARAQNAIVRLRALDPDHRALPSLQKEADALTVPQKAGDTFKNQAGMTLAYIPAGRYRRGSPADELWRLHDEDQVDVEIAAPFFIGVTEVTQKQWDFVMNAVLPMAPQSINNPSRYKGADLPVDSVSREAAELFCMRLNALEKDANRVYRLPTEDEWEYACRAGSQGPYGARPAGEPANVDEMAWHRGTTANDRITRPAGGKKPNAWGLYDMHGNVLEWCANMYPDYDADRTGRTPSTNCYVLRGGAVDNQAMHCRSAARYRWWKTREADPTCGLRIVMRHAPAAATGT